MKRIILVRHSNAESQNICSDDFNRKLTPQGIGRVQSQLISFKELNIIPDVIYSSNAVRSKQTAELFAEGLAYKSQIMFEPFLYDDYTTHEFFTFLYKWSNQFNTVMLVAHNPSLTTMAYRIGKSAIVGMNPCAIFVFECEVNYWKEVEVGCGILRHYLA